MGHIEKLEKLSACREAVEWARGHPNAKAAWQACDRGDWMLWYLGKLAGNPESTSRRRLTLVCCKCARLALAYVPDGEIRPLVAIETAEKWARHEPGVSLGGVRSAAAAASAAAGSASAASAAEAAYAAAAAADAAGSAYAASAAVAAVAAADAASAAYAASAAAAAAYAASAAVAADAAAAAAIKETLAECARIVREEYPNPVNLIGGANAPAERTA